MKKIIIIIIIIFIPILSVAQKSTKKSGVSTQSSKKHSATQPKKLKIGGTYKGGIVYELYEDGSGGKVFIRAQTGLTYDESIRNIENKHINGLELYMASDYELQNLFNMGLVGPAKGHGNANQVWFLGERRNAGYEKPYGLTLNEISNLSNDSNERIAYIVEYGSKLDRYRHKCWHAIIGHFSL
jgi:hypothetical protein